MAIEDERFDVSRPVGCDAPPGSPTDLSAEPASWLAFSTHLRWADENDCPVRLDVISHYRGADHCDWAAAEFITIGRPIGASIDRPEARFRTNRYVWDPTNVVPSAPQSETIGAGELPSSAVDTGYRQDGDELWLDPADESVLYRVTGETADVFRREPEPTLCD